jgi:type VI secretion system ImpB/VipA family protein
MLESNIKLELNIKNHLCSANEINQQPTLGVELKINNLRDFHPDALTKQVPELDMLLKFRTLLKKVKSQPAQINTTIKEIQQLLADTQKMSQPK